VDEEKLYRIANQTPKFLEEHRTEIKKLMENYNKYIDPIQEEIIKIDETAKRRKELLKENSNAYYKTFEAQINQLFLRWNEENKEYDNLK